MVEIQVERSSNRITSFTLNGHADAGPYGYDLVCAAVSAVSIGAINAVFTLCNVELPTETGKEGGFLRCVVPNNLPKETDEKVQLLIEGMLVSLDAIAQEYSEHITIQEVFK
ncbi:ribosomal-processing cysteine protease Prp [Pueribacillus theae]|uniref:Ribosomal processing cysteine protease Prp n=2 Tax=Pueribacillus theae TaxID=2171751 RepID=A0A2U1K0Q6_9BACI|nr:ribosomal-processing cysteine protease Prp [Pueribacillus theae]PWA10759.1 ribosomal-processing cysteine protease Prp [Pueribacillus theae]